MEQSCDVERVYEKYHDPCEDIEMQNDESTMISNQTISQEILDSPIECWLRAIKNPSLQNRLKNDLSEYQKSSLELDLCKATILPATEVNNNNQICPLMVKLQPGLGLFTNNSVTFNIHFDNSYPYEAP